MKIKLRNELIPLNLLVLVLIIAIILFPSNALRIALGLPFLLFFPGYTLMAALFPKRQGIDAIKRIALSFGISIAIVPLVGLILNYTPWGITLESTLYSMACFIFIMSIVAWVRRKRLWEERRLGLEFQLRLPSWGGSASEKILSVVLVIVAVGALATLGYVLATPKVGEKFTEFYILGAEGKAADYPIELVVGKEGRVIIGIVNHEHETMSYWIQVTVNGLKDQELGPVVLGDEEKWEVEMSFIPKMPGDNQKVELFLYKNGEVEPSLGPLQLWLNVRD